MSASDAAQSLTPHVATVVPIGAARARARRTAAAIVAGAAREIGRKGQWDEMVHGAPAVKVMAHNMARYLGESVPDAYGKRSLLAACMEQGIRTWNDRETPFPQPVIIPFAKGLLLRATDVFAWEISRAVEQGVSIWNPLEQPMARWWNGQGGMPEARRRNIRGDSAFAEVTPADYRALVLVRFLAIGKVSVSPFLGRMDYVVSRYE